MYGYMFITNHIHIHNMYVFQSPFKLRPIGREIQNAVKSTNTENRDILDVCNYRCLAYIMYHTTR